MLPIAYIDVSEYCPSASHISLNDNFMFNSKLNPFTLHKPNKRGPALICSDVNIKAAALKDMTVMYQALQ